MAIKTKDVFFPKDPYNDKEKTQFIQCIIKGHPEASVRGYCPRGKSVTLPEYVEDLAIKDSYIHNGHVVFKTEDK